MIQVKNISLTLGETQVLDAISFNLSRSDKVGLVGVNGAGKTTLLRLILGDLRPDSGEIVMPHKARIGYVPQSFDLQDGVDTQSAVRSIIGSGRPIQALQDEMADVYRAISQGNQPMMRRLDALQAEFESWGGFAAESEMMRIVKGVRIDESCLDRPYGLASGGEKSRILFARALYARPDILLLDEPTNHLDAAAKQFVIGFLRTYRRTVVCVSHDGGFLDGFVNKIIHLDGQTRTATIHAAGYTEFLAIQEDAEEAKLRLHAKQTKEEARLKGFIDRMQGVSGKRKRQAQSREKTLARLTERKVVLAPKPGKVRLRFEQGGKVSPIAISIDRLTYGYPRARLLFKDFSLRIQRGERLAVVGPNGAGKTTLLKLVAGELAPQSGEIVFGTHADPGYYAQEHEGLEAGSTVLEEAGRESDLKPKELRSVLAAFLFTGSKVFQRVATLSPGERSRLCLAKLVLRKRNILLLDEPTNHLDPATRSIVGAALNAYGGTMVVVSHDTDFIEALGIEMRLVLPQGK